jgi:thioredoxin-dependent peroxiredoxin
MLNQGDVAPDFTLTADDGSSVTLSALRGKQVVLYFYPADDTPGCTTESCSFRDNLSMLTGKGAVVLGISPQNIHSKAKFKQKYSLNFPLLADEDHAVAEAYGAWGLKHNYGKEYMGILRTTFVIDERGAIKKVFEKVKPEGHAIEVLAVL